MQRPTSLPRAFLTLCIVLAIAIVAAFTAQAETGDRPEPTLAVRQQTTDEIPPLPRPIYLYSGSCDDLGEIQWPLNNLTSPDGEDGGSEDADRTEYSFTANVPIAIGSMLSGDFAVNIHESGENIANSIACGNIGGVADSVGTLVIGVREEGGSDVTGIAVLAPSPSDSAMTLVSVFITGTGLGDATGTIGIPPPPVADDNPPVENQPPADDVPIDDGGGDDDDGGDDDGGGDD